MLTRKKTGNAVALGAAFITMVALLVSGCEGIMGGDDAQDAERPVITAYPQGYSVALNGTAAPLVVTAAVSDGGTLSYRWHSAASDTEEGTAITGTDGANASYTPPVTAAGSVYYYVVVTNTNNNATGNKTAAVTSNRAKVEVIADIAAYTAVQSGGTEGETDTTAIIFTFDKDIGSLDINDINVTGSVVKGTTVTKNPDSNVWTLPVTVNSAGNVVVYISKNGVESAPRTVTVYKEGQTNVPDNAELATYTVAQSGGAENTTDTTAIVFTFDKDIGSLDVSDITVTEGVVKGTTVTKNPDNNVWTLPVTVNSAGGVAVFIIKEGVESAPKTVTVYKQGQATPDSTNDAERPVITAYPQGYTITVNGAATPLAVTAAVSDGGTLSYRWHSAASATAAGTAITGATGTSYTPPVTTAGSVYYYVVVTNTNNNAAGNKTAAVTSNRVEVKVEPIVNARTGNSITKFTIGSETADDLVEGDIDNESQTIVIVLPSTQTDFTVAVTISDGAGVALLEAERNGVSKYRVTAENGTAKDYTVYKTWLGGAGLELAGGPFASTGNLSVAVTPPERWPNAVSRSVGNGKENQFVLTATEGYDHYRWYVDGEQFFYYNSADPSPDSNVVDKLTGGNYAAGKHTLFLVAIKNGVPSTWEQVFTVIE